MISSILCYVPPSVKLLEPTTLTKFPNQIDPSERSHIKFASDVAVIVFTSVVLL